MVHIIERDAVKEEQVLVGAATAHIHATGAFVAALHAGQQLDGLDDVCLAEEDGNRLNLLHRYFYGTHL